MTEWSNSINFAVAMLILTLTISTGLTFVSISSFASQNMQEQVNDKLSNTQSYIFEFHDKTQDWATAQASIKSILVTTPCHLAFRNHFYYDLYDGESSTNTRLSFQNLNEDFNFMTTQHGKYKFEVITDVSNDYVKRFGPYVRVTKE